jgi:hypothetical protein
MRAVSARRVVRDRRARHRRGGSVRLLISPNLNIVKTRLSPLMETRKMTVRTIRKLGRFADVAGAVMFTTGAVALAAAMIGA